LAHLSLGCDTRSISSICARDLPRRERTTPTARARQSSSLPCASFIPQLPKTILAAARDHLDFSQPVALMLMGVLGHIEDHAVATEIVRRFQADLPAGSYFMHYDRTDTDADLAKAQDGYNRIVDALPYILRSPDQIASYYEGLELLDPGIVSCPLWRPDPDPDNSPRYTDIYGGVAREAQPRCADHRRYRPPAPVPRNTSDQ
jgi:hypothetical protein